MRTPGVCLGRARRGTVGWIPPQMPQIVAKALVGHLALGTLKGEGSCFGLNRFAWSSILASIVLLCL